MFKELNYKSPLSEMDSKYANKSKKIFEDCQKVIKELQSELQYALQQNQQKDQIIKLLTQQKEYYEQECHKNDEKLYPKLKEQHSFNQSLLNGLKQYNKQLTEKNTIIEQENKELWEKCKEKDEILKITEYNIVKLQQQKSKLQREWGQTLRCVKKKIFQIQHENNANDPIVYERQMGKKRAVSRGGQKKNLNPKEQKRKDSMNNLNQEKNESKVQEILKEIDRKLLNYDFLDMIQSKELRKQMKNRDNSESNKENISENINPKAFNKNDIKNKKIPILKLSELTLKDDSL